MESTYIEKLHWRALCVKFLIEFTMARVHNEKLMINRRPTIVTDFDFSRRTTIYTASLGFSTFCFRPVVVQYIFYSKLRLITANPTSDVWAATGIPRTSHCTHTLHYYTARFLPRPGTGNRGATSAGDRRRLRSVYRTKCNKSSYYDVVQFRPKWMRAR